MRYGALLRVSKNASMVMLGTIVRMAMVFAFAVFVARWYGVEYYGKFALATNLFELFLSLSATGLCILVTRETAKDREWLGRNLTSALVVVQVLGVAAAAILIGIAQLADYAPDTRLAICVAAIALVPASVCSLGDAVFMAWERGEYVAAGTAGESLVRTLLCFGVLWLGYGLVSLFVVLIATRLMMLMAYAVLIRRRLPDFQPRIPAGATIALVKQWRVFAAENWLSTIANGLDVFLLSLYHGEAAVGLYDAAWKLIRLNSVVARSFTTAVFPYIARLYVRAEDVFHQVNLRSIKYILAGVLPAVIGLSLLADKVVLFLYGEEFLGSVPVLQVLAWLMIPQFLNPFLSHILFARHQQQRSLVVAIVGMVTFVISAFLFIPSLGAIGAAWTVLATGMVSFCCYLAFCVWGKNTLNLIAILLRQAVAAGALCVFLHYMRDSELLPALGLGAVLYAVMLVALRIVSWNDWKMLQELH